MITTQTGSLIAVPPSQHSTRNTLTTSGFMAFTLTALLLVGIFVWRKRKTASTSMSQSTALTAESPSGAALTSQSTNPAVLTVTGGGVLVIVDMQPNFSAANDPNTIAEVKKEILYAVGAGDFIFVLEYAGEGRTHFELMELIENYQWHEVLTKSNNDGSSEVQSACHRLGLNPSYLRVVGVNSDACVRETVTGLSRNFKSQIFVIKKACNCSWSHDWKLFPTAPNIAVH